MYRNLKRPESPYVKGRWFKIFVECDHVTASITSSDIEECAITDNTHLNFPHDLRIIDVLCDIHNTEFDSGSANINNVWYATPGGAKYILLPAVKAWDYGDIWVYGYRTGEV